MAPHRGHDGEDSLALESAVRHPQVLAPSYEGEGAEVHVEDHEESVRDLVGVVLRVLEAGHGVRVVVGLAPAQVPAPAVLIAAHQRLVAGRVKWGLLGGDPHHGVGPVLPAGPDHLEDVEARAVVLPAPDAVGALSHGVTVEAQQVVLLHEDVEAAVVRVPGVPHLLSLVGRRGVQRHLHPDRQLVAHNGAAADLAGAALLEVPVAVTFHLLHPPGDGGSHTTVTPQLPVRPGWSPAGLSGPVVSRLSLRPRHQALTSVPLAVLGVLGVLGVSPSSSSGHVRHRLTWHSDRLTLSSRRLSHKISRSSSDNFSRLGMRTRDERLGYGCFLSGNI